MFLCRLFKRWFNCCAPEIIVLSAGIDNPQIGFHPALGSVSPTTYRGKAIYGMFQTDNLYWQFRLQPKGLGAGFFRYMHVNGHVYRAQDALYSDNATFDWSEWLWNVDATTYPRLSGGSYQVEIFD